MFWSKKKQKSATICSNQISLEFFDPEAKEIFLCGDFNSWNVVANPLKRDTTGRWKTVIELSPGRYEYRFLVDGQWRNDQRPVYLVDNAFGTQNCLIEI